MRPQKPRNYLAQFYSANDNALPRMRKANILARAIYPKSGVKSFATMQIRIVGLHEKGAIIQSKAIEFLPEHFYICLGAGEIFFTCAQKNIIKGEMVVAFSEAEDSFFIEALSRLVLPLASLSGIRDACPPIVQARMRTKGRPTVTI
ncbi:hypothetical protein GAO09_28010 [Rhizobiales bacterium RZME27]|uniref:PilZ domain-containing protein n=1 Tax=Endobacterium cereale TaxID=2663029 RepID=A0A6A8AL30_9HYPH|nr:hypothetical protein [Endobacterium cereale]MEB2842864.1 hypothetical protein [Endobacterium cereale]MQY49876.1 hypothetical protein [Endobacterium cereale]